MVDARKNTEPATQPRPARRTLLTGGAVGLAAIAGATLAGAQPASAATANVTWITPLGNGKDDKSQIQTALNAGGLTLLAPGKFTISSGLTMPVYGSVLAGSGPGVTLLNATGSGTFLSAHGGSPPYPFNVPGFQITGFTLDLSAVTASSVGIDFGDGSNIYIDQVRVTAEDPMPTGTIPIWEINRNGWTEKAFVRVQVYNPPAGNNIVGGSAGYVIDQVSGDPSHMYSWHEIHLIVNGAGCGVQLTNGCFVENARMFKIYGDFFQSSLNPTDTFTGVPFQWCLSIDGHDGAGNYSRISNSPVEIGVETDSTSSGNATQWRTINFGSASSSDNRMLDDHGQLTFLAGNDKAWYASNAGSGNLTFGGVIVGDSSLTGANSAPSGWL